MNIECGERWDIFDEELEEMSVDSLKSLRQLISSCNDCPGCEGQIKMLEKMIAERE